MRRTIVVRRPRLVRTPPTHASARPRGRASRRRTRHGRRRAGRSAADRPDRGSARCRREPRRERARRDRRGQAQAAAQALGRLVRPQAAEAKWRDAVRAITDRLAARGDVVSAEPDALLQPMSVPTDPSWGQEWDMFAPSSRQLRDRPPRRARHHARLVGHHDRRDRHGLPAAHRSHRPLRRRLRLHRRHSRCERRQRTRLRRERSRRLDHERREREWVLRRLRGVATARGTARTCPARSAPCPTTASASPGSTRSRRSSRCGCSASAAATRVTSPTRSAGPPDCP